MSTSKLIAKESLTAYERWELPNMVEPEPVPESSHSEEVEEEAIQPFTAEQLEEIHKEAWDEGFEQGLQEGRKEGLQAGENEVQACVQRLGQVIQALAEPLEAIDTQVEEELAALAIAIAHQLIRRELKTDPGQVIAVVREAISALPSNATPVQLFLHPEDAALVRERLPLPEGDEPSWRIVDEPVLTRGGCRVESEFSRIDATLEKRLAAVVARVMGGERNDDVSP